MMRLPFDFPDPIIDPRNGYAVNIDLGDQAPAEFWRCSPGAEIRAQILQLRAEIGIEVEDNIEVVPRTEPVVNALDHYLNGDPDGDVGG